MVLLLILDFGWWGGQRRAGRSNSNANEICDTEGSSSLFLEEIAHQCSPNSKHSGPEIIVVRKLKNISQERWSWLIDEFTRRRRDWVIRCVINSIRCRSEEWFLEVFWIETRNLLISIPWEQQPQRAAAAQSDRVATIDRWFRMIRYTNCVAFIFIYVCHWTDRSSPSGGWWCW